MKVSFVAHQLILLLIKVTIWPVEVEEQGEEVLSLIKD